MALLPFLLARPAIAGEGRIRHTPPATLPQDHGLLLQVEVVAPEGVVDAFVGARVTGGAFRHFALTPVHEGTYETSIPKAFLRGHDALEYYIAVYTQTLDELRWHSEKSPYRLARERARVTQHRLDIRVLQQGAVIDIDGVTAGVSPFGRLLDPGPHRLDIHMSGFASMTLDITMPGDRDLLLEPRLKPLQEDGTAAAAPPAAGTQEATVTVTPPEQQQSPPRETPPLPESKPPEKEPPPETAVPPAHGAPAEEIEVSFNSAPAEAAVYVDADLKCDATPCSRRIPAGKHVVVMTKARYLSARSTIMAAPGSAVKLTLRPDFGTLVVTTDPPGLTISVDGESMGESSSEPLEVKAGEYEVAVSDPCMTPVSEHVVLGAGQRQEVRLSASPRVGQASITAEDAGGNEIDGATVTLEGKRLGTAPGVFPLPICVKRLEVATDDGRRWTSSLKLKEGWNGTIRAVLQGGAPVVRHTRPPETKPETKPEMTTDTQETRQETRPPEPPVATWPFSTGRTAGIASAVVGGVALIIAVGLAGKVQADTTALDAKPPMTGTIDAAFSNLRMRAVGADVLFGLGGACAATGVGLVVAF
jgi:hypothetical protein